MDFNNKYIRQLADKMKTTLEHWRTLDEIPEKEIYVFLHGIRGTAGTIGLQELSEIAKDLLYHLDEDGESPWSRRAWGRFLMPIIKVIKKVDLEKSEELEAEVSNEKSVNSVEVIDDSRFIAGTLEDRVILLIEEDIILVTYLIEHLEKEGYQVLIARTIQKGLEIYYTMRPAFVILSLEIVKAEASKEEAEQLIKITLQGVIPLAIMGKAGNNEDRILAYKLGALDYLARPIKEDIFIPYLQNRLYMKQKLQQKVTVDELTGLYNRKHLNQILENSIGTYNSTGEKFVLCMIDLDYFKHVNDQYGHLVGDEVLRELGKHLQNGLSSEAKPFRYGGEEFTIILPGISEEKAAEQLNKLREKFSKVIFTSGEDTFTVTWSAGITIMRDGIKGMEDIIHEADQALYRSKSAGRNRVTIHSNKSSVSNQRKLHLMIIDDDALVRKILEQGFSEWQPQRGVTVSVETFKDGLDFIESDWYNTKDQYVILLDGMMPKMDGIEVLSTLRKRYPEKNIVISMLSARSHEKNIIHALEKGADDYLIKPFNLEEVIARIDRLVHRMLF